MTEVNIEQWKRANQIYTQLMDLTVSEALSQLSQMDDLNDELKSLVLSLVSSGSQSSQYFKQQVGANFQLENLSLIDYKVGDQVDGYVLLKELGVGGMAKVFEATRVGTESQKPVAIKLFNRIGVSPILLNRFSIEQEVLSGLSHPNIVNMHHGGSSEQGVPYIVMELIGKAQDIDVYVKSHQASVKQTVKWILSAAKAIAYAHNNLIIHRDIKPSNLLIDDSGQLKVVDFGIAKLMTTEEAPQKTTILALTPSFAAPEQINSGPISVSTDVFSLAAVCLSLIIDDLPLPADRLLKSCTGDEAHIWQLLRTQVKDRDLRNILNRALQQDPLKRYRNMDMFVDDLSAWLAQKPVQATPDSWMYRIKKFAVRRSALFATLCTLVVMIVLGVVLMGKQVEKTQAEAAKAKEVKNFMLGVFSVVNPDEALGEKILAKDLLSQAFAEIKAKEFNDTNIKAELLTAMGQAQLQLGLSQKASDSFEAALAINRQANDANMGMVKTLVAVGDYAKAKQRLALLEESMSPQHELMSELLLMKSILTGYDAQYEAAEQHARKAQQLFQQQKNIKGYLEAGRQLSNVMFLKSETEAAADLLEQLLAFGLQQLAPTSTVILGIQNDLVEIHNDIGDYDQANIYSEQLIENIKTVLGDKHPFLIQAYLSRAGTNRSVGEIEAAKLYANMALSLSTELNGKYHVTTARALNLVAVLSYVNGEIETALEQMKQASMLFDQVLGSEHPDSWDVKTNLTALLNMSQRFDEAIEIIEPVFKKQTEVLGKSHKSTIYSQAILARLYGDVGRLAEAQTLGETLLDTAIMALGTAHPLTVGAHFTLASIYKKQADFPRAIKLLEQVIQDDSWSDDNERAITAYNTLADLYLQNDEPKVAASYKEKSLQLAIDLLTEKSPRTLSQMLKNIAFYLAIKDTEHAQQGIEKVSVLLASNPVLKSDQHLQKLQAFEAELLVLNND